MSVAAAAPASNGHWLPLRFALRELRGGLRGFYVFIACIALGCMAIAGVGSLAASLGEGLAREGRVILGGDLAFTLIQREAAPNELRVPAKPRRAVERRRRCARWRATANGKATLVETEGGRWRLSALRRGQARSGDADLPTRWRSATAPSAPPPIRR